VSPSIVTALKLSATPSESSFCKTRDETGASVKTNDSMVAMSGAIMPAPLAMPLMVTVPLPMLAVAVATLGKVSVVMIALAASFQNFPVAAVTSPSITPSNALALSGSPITPVEARNTSFGLQPIARAAISAVNLQASRPVFPVKALALPELTTSARGLALLRLARHHSTGADGHFDLVNTPATAVLGSSSASSTSVRLGYLMPAAAVASLTPAIAGISGTDVGARGDTGAGAAMTGLTFVMPGLVPGIHDLEMTGL